MEAVNDSIRDWWPILALVITFTVVVAGSIFLRNSSSKSKTGNNRKMTKIGLSTLKSETDTNLSIPVMLIRMSSPITLEEYITTLKRLMAADPHLFQRYHCLVKDGYFVELEDHNLEMNVETVELSPGQTPLQFTEKVANTPLQMDRPLWKCHLIEDYNGESYAVWRIHHCIGDGMSLGMMFVKTTDNVEEFLAKMKEANRARPIPATANKRSNMLMGIVGVVLYVKKLVSLALERHPTTMFNVKGGKDKFLRVSEVLTVSRAKAIGKAHGATLNDVLLAAIAGAIRRTLLKYDPKSLTPDLTLHCAIPVDMRPSDEEITTTHNRFSSYVIALPVGVESSIERLKRINKCMIETKASAEKHVTYAMAKLLGHLPAYLARCILESMSGKVTLGVSNVRGFPDGLRFSGRKILNSIGFMPPPPGVNIGILISSRGDKLIVSLLADKLVLEKPEEFLENIIVEFDEMETSAASK